MKVVFLNLVYRVPRIEEYPRIHNAIKKLRLERQPVKEYFLLLRLSYFEEHGVTTRGSVPSVDHILPCADHAISVQCTDDVVDLGGADRSSFKVSDQHRGTTASMRAYGY